MYGRAYESDKREPEARGVRLSAPSLISSSHKNESLRRKASRASTHAPANEGFQNRRDSIKNRPIKISPREDDPTANRRNPTIDNRDFPSSEHREYTRSCIGNFTVYRILINATHQSSNSPIVPISKGNLLLYD